MESEKITQAAFLDILFEGRNKEYGAYQLRKTYNGRLMKAMSAMLAICLLLIFGYALAGKYHKTETPALIINDNVDLTAIKNPEKPIEIPKPQTVAVQVATIHDAVVRIVPDQQVRPEDIPPTNDQIDNARIGTSTTAGAADLGIQGPPAGPAGDGTGVTATPPSHEEDDNTPRMTVEIESSYPGGLQAWKYFLEKTMRYPEEAIAQGVSGTVVVQFIVDKEGHVSDVHAIGGPELLRSEAERVIKKSKLWTPAIQNGRHVASYKRQPIILQLQDQ